jgi:mono/diheme cytochrome c family protein
MTRRGWTVLTVFAFAVLAGCAASRPEYNVPPDVTGENRTLLLDRARKGRDLFRKHCADCHGIFTAGRDSVPNFSVEQLDSYDANFVKADQKNHAVARKLSQQQVDYILTYLRLRVREAK